MKDATKIVGYASVFGIADYHNDIITNGAFQESIRNHRTNNQVKLLWQHEITKPIGVVTSLKEDKYGLLVEAIINQDTQQGKEASSLISQGAVSGLSIGFIIKDSELLDSGLRKVTNLDLWEISVVTFPANQQAHINYLTCQSDAQGLATLSNNLLRTEQYINNLINRNL